jgi:hypothetical protein
MTTGKGKYTVCPNGNLENILIFMHRKYTDYKLSTIPASACEYSSKRTQSHPFS